MARRALLAWFVLLLACSFRPAHAWADTEDKKPEASAEEDYYELFKVLVDTLDQVERNYVEDVSRRELFEAAIEGVLKKLDPYSNYIAPEELDRFKGAIEREFGGIGIMIGFDQDDGQLKITSPLYGTPAYRAGLLAGDRIVQIEGEPTEGLSIDEAVRRLKGKEGTTVTFTVIHPDGKRETVTVEREIIQVETVLGDQRKEDDTWDFMLDEKQGIGYVRLTAFSRDTARDLRRAIRGLEDRGLKGLILDLRFNPGGLLSSAIEVCDMFISEGRIVSTKGRNRSERSWDAHKPGTFGDFPMAVLVNRYSASASEIVSACLQDHGRAVVIGERTWGKGSVQSVVDLEEGRSALKITTHSYWRPNGKNIHRGREDTDDDEWGVTPNDGYLVKLRDVEVGRLLKYRQDRDILISHLDAEPAEDGQADEPAEDDGAVDSRDEPVDESDDDEPAADDSDQAEMNEAADDAPSENEANQEVEEGGDDDSADEEGGQDEEDSAKEETASDDATDTDEDESEPRERQFVDRQLQKAIDYLTRQLAQAS
jgi:carboxyl-terminal processing protease